jgi:DNA transformation protein and related proteins
VAGVDPDYIGELFSSFGPVTVRRMFGGAGVFADGLMIALISNSDIFLKADSETSAAFEREGMKPFTYGAKRSRVTMSFWRMPDRLLDDQDELAEWAKTALGAARRAAAKKSVARRKRPSPMTKNVKRRKARR